jgi:hypothetical protein
MPNSRYERCNQVALKTGKHATAIASFFQNREYRRSTHTPYNLDSTSSLRRGRRNPAHRPSATFTDGSRENLLDTRLFHLSYTRGMRVSFLPSLESCSCIRGYGAPDTRNSAYAVRRWGVRHLRIHLSVACRRRLVVVSACRELLAPTALVGVWLAGVLHFYCVQRHGGI